jgi:hypothetical protein
MSCSASGEITRMAVVFPVVGLYVIFDTLALERVAAIEQFLPTFMYYQRSIVI